MSQVGRPVARVEDARLLTGRGRFIDDADPVSGVLHAAIVRSPHPHARIRHFDAGAALRHPGVAAVIGPEEVAAELRPFSLSAPAAMPYRAAATDTVRYVGEPIAVVVASDRYVAEDAAELVDVELDHLAPVTDITEALGAGTLLHPDAGTNVATDRTFRFGDVDAAFAGAGHVVRGEYSFPRYSSTPIETYGVVAQWDNEADGDLVTAWCNFHGPFVLQPVIAGALGLPPSRVRLIVPPDIGGSFGIKSAIYPYVVLLALASKHAGAPVRWTEDRLEHLLASSAGTDRLLRLEAAVSDDGTVDALRLDMTDNVGAYLRPPEPATMYRCYGNLTGPYRIGAVGIRARAVVTNTAPTGLNRGFGGQQLYFGLERLLDRIAHELDLDPADLRRRNLVPANAFPYHTPTGGVYDSGDYAAVLDTAQKRAGYDALRETQARAREQGRIFGIGVATAIEPSATNLGYVSLATPAPDRKPGREKSGSTETVTVSVDPAGAVTVLLGTTPQGQGHETVARQVVADRLGLDPAQVTARAVMDTATTPWTVTSGSYSSRFSPLTTSALVDAADQVAATVKAAASTVLGVPVDDLELSSGKVASKNDPATAMLFRHAAGLVHWDPGSLPPGVEPRLHVEAAFSPHASQHPTSDDTVNSSICYGFVVDIAVVEIDPDTLEIRVEQLTSVHDCGTVLNPLLLEGQILGAIAHAVGGALYEELRYTPDAQLASGTFMDYLCPTAAELGFDLRLDHVSTPSPLTRLGAKGAGEGNSMSTPVAIANAVSDALKPRGVGIDALPVHGSVLHDLLSPPSGDAAASPS